MEKNDFQSITKVSSEDWVIAQEYESNTWVINNRRNGYLKIVYKFIKALRQPSHFWEMLISADFYCGDDWNYWWMKQFDNYQMLPKNIERSLEVGSGPYSNTRLISRLISIKEVYCTDPLMDVYETFKNTWLSENNRTGKIKASKGKAEKIDFPDNYFELVICNNVLDHVEDANQCLAELRRVLKPGGHLILGQELTDDEDMQKDEIAHDVGHPIKLDAKFLDDFVDVSFSTRLKKILTRFEGRVAEHRGGTYIYLGIKK